MSDTLPAATPHKAIEPVFQDVFRVRGTVDFKPLVRLPRNMVIVRHGDELTLINAVRLSDEGLNDLDALGKVAHVVKIGFHGMDDAFYVTRYGAELWALPGVEHGNGQKTTKELFEGNLPFPDAKLFVFEHTKRPECALIVERDGGILLTCDSVQNWVNTDGCSLMASAVTRMMGFVKPAQIGPPWRKMMTPDGGSLRPDFERLAGMPFRHLIGGHGEPMKDEAVARLEDTITRVYG